ncbi:MAG: permease, partial [Ruminococcus sp.]|nr:permease [Ruminococcus sp.]
SPLCMYGTIPLSASFSRKGIRDDWLGAFMMSSILLNPQLIIYSMALGKEVLAVRIITCYVMGVTAGLILRYAYKGKSFFNFEGFSERASHDTDPNLFIRLLKNIGRNFKATGLYFLFGVLLSALFQRYVPAEDFAKLFGSENEGFGLLMAATIGVPLYACGGGTIPLLQQWLYSGMSIGSATSFMLTGPSTKITNLGALKIVLGVRNFILYILYVMLFSMLSGFVVNIIFN